MNNFFNKHENYIFDTKELTFYIMNDYENKNISLNYQKIFKELYYIYGYFFKVFNKEAFNDIFGNWTYGPCPIDIYYDLAIHYDFKNLKLYGNEMNNNNAKELIENNFQYYKLIKRIIETCDKYDINNLINKTKAEDPYQKSIFKENIDKNLIFDYFDVNNPLNIDCKNLIKRKRI